MVNSARAGNSDIAGETFDRIMEDVKLIRNVIGWKEG